MKPAENHLIFFPIERFTFLSCALAGTIYSYKADPKIQPYAKIIKFLKFGSEDNDKDEDKDKKIEFPNSIEFPISQTDESKKIQLFFLTRILAMLILSDFDPKYANIVKVAENYIKDPIEILDQICSAKKNDINSLINLLSIIIEYSDYDIDCISKFASSFTSTFLTTTDLSDNLYGLTKYIFIKKRINNDQDIYNTNGVGIIKNPENTFLSQISKSDEVKFYFLKKIEELNDENAEDISNEIPYASIGNTSFEANFSLLPEKDDDSNKMKCNHNINQLPYLIAEYEMLFTENDEFFQQIPTFSKLIEKSNNSEESPEYKHFYYFTRKIDYLYNQIQENIKQKFDNNDDLFNELYSIVYNITTFNYYIAKTTMSDCEQNHEIITENSFIRDFLILENYLILLIESVDQVSQKSFADDIVNYMHEFLTRYSTVCNNLDEHNDNKNDEDHDENEEEEDTRLKAESNDIEKKKEITDKMINFTLYLFLLNGKKIASFNELSSFICMTIVLINQTDESKRGWIKDIFGNDPGSIEVSKVKGSISHAYKSQKSLFDPSHKIGSMMKNFHWKALDLITRKNVEFERVIKIVKDYGLKFKRIKE